MLHRIEVRSAPGHRNPKADSALRGVQTLGLAHTPSAIEQTDVYLIEGDLSDEQIERIAHELLADPVTQQPHVGAAETSGSAYIEVQPLSGVMDPAASAIELVIRTVIGVEARVQTGQRFDFSGVDQQVAHDIAERSLANTVIHAIHDEPFTPRELSKSDPRRFEIVEVSIRFLDDNALLALSRQGHLFLSLEEMKAIQAEYKLLGREPREIELETLAQTWSEHCVHKTLKSTIRYRESADDQHASPARDGLSIDFSNRPGHVINDDGSVTIHNLLKSTVVAATHELIEEGIDWCLSVFVDNAGIIAFDDENAVCFKCETHNHPSAIEPYGGAATGIGGCIRDIIGTGLAAKPIASTDVFCVAFPDHFSSSPTGTPGYGAGGEGVLPRGCIHPRRILQQVVAGVRDYGNRMGIPTLNGGVWFDDRYVGNPLVYCGSIGVMPRDKIAGDAQPGDRIIAIGGRTGRDGIHGATFSSAELTDTHADEFSHAVQIGSPVTEKILLDAILEARDDREDGCLYNAITDCGAGGFSSAVGEMGEKLGAWVKLENAPLKYEGLTPTEIWISEAQERMVLAVPEANIARLQEICDKHGAEMCDLGYFGTRGRELVLMYSTTEVGRMPMQFLHEGIPQSTRQAVWDVRGKPPDRQCPKKNSPSTEEALLQLLAHPNIASKHWIIRQYDHEVQGNTALKPLVGPDGCGPGDAAVITPVKGSNRGLAIANGLATGFSDDPYAMTLMAIDECVRNLVCVGADPSRIAILDNFCWPSCNDPQNLASLVRAAEACYDGAKAYKTPFISGKDSLNNQFTTEDGETIEIPPTLLISGIGIVPDVTKCVTMDAKRAGNYLVVVRTNEPHLQGSHYEGLFGRPTPGVLGRVAKSVASVLKKARMPVDLKRGPRLALLVHEAIQKGLVVSAHDASEGGLLVAAAEMCIAGNLGLDLSHLESYRSDYGLHAPQEFFGEGPSTYLLEVTPTSIHDDSIENHFDRFLLDCPSSVAIGCFNDSGALTLDRQLNIPITTLRDAWRGTLDW